MKDKYLSVYDVKCILNVSRTTAYSIVHSGRLKSYKVGRLVRIKAEDLQRFIESRPSRPAKKSKGASWKLLRKGPLSVLSRESRRRTSRS